MQVLGVVCLLLPLVAVVSAQDERASHRCMAQNTYGACIMAGSQCSWCKQEGYEHERCNLAHVLIRHGCADTEMISPNHTIVCDREINSPHCNEAGTYECGACICNPGHYGKFCECDASILSSDDYDTVCRMTNTSVICEGKGECICGVCHCYAILTGSEFDPSMKYTGKFCDCDDYSCDYFQGMICGGPERGVCSCGKCDCNPDYTGNDCSCSLRQETCMASNGKECNGVGKCHCGRCICDRDTWFKGPTCEDCSSCEGKCELHKACAMCVGFGSGTLSSEDCRANCSHAMIVQEIDRSDETKRKVCRFRDDEDKCFFQFTYEYDTDKVEVQETKECSPINSQPTILGNIVAILLISLVLLTRVC